MSKKRRKEVSFLFEKAKNHKTIPVNGAFGGQAPNSNTVVANFYVESTATPNIITNEVEGNKLKLDSEKRISRGDILREIQATIMMSPEDAYSIGQWLVEHAEQAIKNKRKGNG